MNRVITRRVAIEALRRADGDAAAAAAFLNTQGVTTANGKPFTARRVRVLAIQAASSNIHPPR